MSEDPKYRVLPHEPVYKNAPLTEYERNNVEGLNSGVGVILWIAIVAFLGFSAGDGFTIATIVASVALASVALAIINLLMKTYKVSELQRKRTASSVSVGNREAGKDRPNDQYGPSNVALVHSRRVPLCTEPVSLCVTPTKAIAQQGA